ncbi:hypothetical protein F7R23_30960 [Burkholderia diffusa]|nr:hypothetical protein F7R23_30960 [Burkholderia diffusa]
MLFEGAERASDAERPILSAQSAACITLRFPSSRTRCAASRRGIEQTAARVVTQQIMLRRWPKTVESCRAAAPNRDNPHFGDA